MFSPVLSRSKWKLNAHGQQIVVRYNENERFVHPVMKALLWALYMPTYPYITIEKPIDDRYKPDVVAFAPFSIRYRQNEPIFWGEAGQVSKSKIASLVKRFPDTHFAIAKWDVPLAPTIELVKDALVGVKRAAPFDIIRFPDGAEKHIDQNGHIDITFDHIDWERL